MEESIAFSFRLRPSQARYGTCCTVFAYAVLLLGALLGKKDSVDVGKHTTGGDGNSSKQLVQFFVILDGKSNVTRHNTRLLVVTGGISGQFQNFGTEVFEDGGQVDRGTGSHAGGVLSLTKVSADTSNGELKASLGR